MTQTSQPQPRTQRFLHDGNGNLVIAQAPNLPLIGWLLCTIAGRLAHGTTSNGLGHIGRASLFTWAYLEITDGANYFRRLLGTAVMVALLVGYLWG